MAETSARDRIFANIRESLNRGPLSQDRRDELTNRLAAAKPNLIPEQAKSSQSAADIAARFIAKAEDVACTVAVIASDEAVPEAVADYLRENNLGGDLALAPSDYLNGLPWDKTPLITLKSGATGPQDQVSLTPAMAGVAETGTLIVTSGGDDDHGHPTSLNFTPDYHLVALKTSQLKANYEDAWQVLRANQTQNEETSLPRTMNMITGPSRTGDIGLKIHLGAHGPRSLHILLIDDLGAIPEQGMSSAQKSDEEES